MFGMQPRSRGVSSRAEFSKRWSGTWEEMHHTEQKGFRRSSVLQHKLKKRAKRVVLISSDEGC